MSVNYILSQYIDEAMSQAVYDRLEDGTFVGRSQAQELNISRTALYDKLNGIEPEVSAALVRESSRQLGDCIDLMGGALPDLVQGYQVRILDGRGN